MTDVSDIVASSLSRLRLIVWDLHVMCCGVTNAQVSFKVPPMESNTLRCLPAKKAVSTMFVIYPMNIDNTLDSLYIGQSLHRAVSTLGSLLNSLLELPIIIKKHHAFWSWSQICSLAPYLNLFSVGVPKIIMVSSWTFVRFMEILNIIGQNKERHFVQTCFCLGSLAFILTV